MKSNMDKLIRVKPKTHSQLKNLGNKDESFDYIINKILKGEIKKWITKCL